MHLSSLYQDLYLRSDVLSINSRYRLLVIKDELLKDANW